MNSNRRDFIKTIALAYAGAQLSPLTAKGFSRTVIPPDPMIGIQMAPHSFFDEGIEPTLDFLADKAAVNTVMIYSHTYYGIDRKPLQVLARDHGYEPKDLAQRKFPHVWVRHHEQAFSHTRLRHEVLDPDLEYAGRDIFKEIRKHARARNIKVFARMLEAGDGRGSGFISNFDSVKTVNILGHRGPGACWNHPDYREWLYATMEDVFSQYDLDGLQYGAERTGPLSLLLFKGEAPACFCSFCKIRNESRGIDMARASEGYSRLYEFVKGVEGGKAHTDSVMVNVMRVFQHYPEVLSWNYQWFQADEEIQKEMYLRVKKINPEATVGRHVDHQRSSWDLFYRSAVDYADMTSYTDFIKPILYHDVFGPRLRWWVVEEWQKRFFNDLTREQSLELIYAWMGYSPSSQVDLDRLEVEGMGPMYVYDEVQRCVRAVDGKVPVVAGIGIDVMWHSPSGPQPFYSDPGKLQQAVFKAFEAGAGGVLASREYDEMRHSSLRAFGDAVRQVRR